MQNFEVHQKLILIKKLYIQKNNLLKSLSNSIFYNLLLQN